MNRISRSHWYLTASFVLASIAACSGGGSSSEDAATHPGTGGAMTGGPSTGSGGGGNPSTGGGGMQGGDGGPGMPTGTGGNPGSGGAMTIPETGQSVLQRNKDIARTGHFIQPKLTHAAVANMMQDAAFTAAYTGGTWGVPLYMEDGAMHKGTFFIATMGNDVVAFDETTGATTWTKNLGPIYANAPCGGPYKTVGIFGTPAIDPASRTLFVVAPTPTLNFMVHALSVDDGSEKAGWPVDASMGAAAVPVGKHNQRGALSLVNGVLYIPFGGHWGDCNPYQGRVLAIDTTDPTKRGVWATQGERGAIWGTGGLASDGTSIFAVTGDSARKPPAMHAPEAPAGPDSNAVLRLTGLAVLPDRTAANYYYPTRWAAMDAADLDFGSNSPVFIKVPMAKQAGFVVATSKDGHMAFLDSAHLGGQGGEIVDLVVAQSGMSIHTAPASYTTAMGTYVTISTDSGAHCPAGGGTVVMGVRVNVMAGGMIAPTVAWCAPNGTVTSPIATTTDGKTDPIVWYMSGTGLVGVDGDTGMPVAKATGACPGVMRWTSPIAAQGRIIVGGGTGLCSWSVK
ncbi:MAG TPA: hypothetical protein VMU50_21605 [Polyangia bacterium]|nr:hypothetical protein [Polyangia bacterium]